MGKSKLGLGRTIIKDRFGGQRGQKKNESFLHTSELNDGVDWGRLSSVTEPNNLDDFLATAELAQTEFTAERLNAKLIDPKSQTAIESLEEQQITKEAQDKYRQMLKIPRRPNWDKNMTGEELQEKEREAFLDWRKILAQLQDIERVILTPFERNLEFWRQLWRVIEKSDILVQIVDARNPLLFRSEDLEKYVKEVSKHKINMILVNKADLLTSQQRNIWANYFNQQNLKVVFWSALQETESQKSKNEVSHNSESDLDNSYSDSDDEVIKDSEDEKDDSGNEKFSTPTNYLSSDSEDFQDCDQSINEITNLIEDIDDFPSVQNLGKLLSKQELIDLFKSHHKGQKVQPGVTTVGLVGYPNVGKSSTINALLQYKKVPVSATPGRTKHFQTIYLEPELLLCDCPGLVMPSFVTTKAEMVVSGILSIDQLRDHISPIALICQRIPRHILEKILSVILPTPNEQDEVNRSPSPEELLNAYGYMRGFMTPRGMPDGPRSARYILKDYVNGKLLYCFAPPHLKQEKFHLYPPALDSNRKLPTATQIRATQTQKVVDSKTLDREFIKPILSGAHRKGVKAITGYNSITGLSGKQSIESSTLSLPDKPWKKHNNKNKREKLRRVYSHLDD